MERECSAEAGVGTMLRSGIGTRHTACSGEQLSTCQRHVSTRGGGEERGARSARYALVEMGSLVAQDPPVIVPRGCG
jgi:hypothetical protein